MANSSWQIILQSDLRPLIYLSSFRDGVDRQTLGEETLRLKHFLNLYNAYPDSIHVCQSALERVQWMLDVCKQELS